MKVDQNGTFASFWLCFSGFRH